MRVTHDDQRRVDEIWKALSEFHGDHPIPHVIAIEAFAPFGRGKGGGNAWKTAVGYGVVSAFGRARNMPVFSFLPSDLKTAFTLSRSASKDEVAAALSKKVDGVEAAVGAYKKEVREHLTDAIGHAYICLTELMRIGSTLQGDLV